MKFSLSRNLPLLRRLIGLEHRPGQDANELFFSQICGVGILLCKDCGISEDVLAFVHSEETCHVGYQCSDCSVLNVFTGLDCNKSNLICECGGRFSREVSISCPSCNSKNVEYELDLLT